uniref:Uncharacterized protein n=1 Tax=Knipowitschia caucasica TaxID=637954 RepID=A0AAV2JBD2_KNICA
MQRSTRAAVVTGSSRYGGLLPQRRLFESERRMNAVEVRRVWERFHSNGDCRSEAGSLLQSSVLRAPS